jgi:MFS family permease
VIFSLVVGIIADRSDRRRILMVTQAAMTIVAIGLAAMSLTHNDAVWLIYGLNALSAAAIAFDGPARQALVPRLVPRHDLPGALSLNLTVFHASMIIGPALAGLLIAGTGAVLLPDVTLPVSTTGLSWIYGINAVSFVAVLGTLFLMDPAMGLVSSRAGADEHPLESLKAGLRFVFTTPLMVWTMTLDFFATFFAGAMSLLPIFADQILHAGPAGYGILVSAPALGALLGSIYTSVRPLPARRQGRVFLWAVAAYGVATVVFGLSRSYLLTFIALAGTGLADVISTVIRQTLRQFVTPDELRGRMTSINMIFFMGGPQLGEMEAGLVASLFASTAVGATVSVATGGAATILLAIVIAAVTPVLRNYDLSEHMGSRKDAARA